MGAVRWLAALSVLPFAWGHLVEARGPRQSIIKKTDTVRPPLFRFRLEAEGEGAPASSDLTGPVDPTPPLECFQVAEPILTEAGLTLRGASKPYVDETVEPAATPSCSQVLMVHSFASSYGAPFVGTCPGPRRGAGATPAHRRQETTHRRPIAISTMSSSTSRRS